MRVVKITLRKSKLEDFKKYLDSIGVAYRPGKGTWQELQVLTSKWGWQCLYNKTDMPEYFTMQDKLTSLVESYSKKRKEEENDDNG